VKHQGSGWDFTIDELRRYYERVEARVKRTEGRDGLDGRDRLDGHPPFFAALENWYLSTATTLGKRTAELHLTLASASGPAFAPEALDGAAIEALAREMRTHAESSLDLLARQIGTLNDASRPIADAVLAERTSLLARFDELAAVRDAGLRIRVHGDYHLGQVLRTEEDFVILDFEGEPARSIAERRAKQSPLKDVAGMVRSYSYAAYAALFAYTVNAPDEYAPLESWADTWQHWVADAFLGGYASTIGESPLVPRGAAWQTLIRAFVLDKALYELAYELNNRPEWVRIPLIGINKLAGSGGSAG
jgi:maltose alpha-D-glucosyltransferase/alpha-amylase